MGMRRANRYVFVLALAAMPLTACRTQPVLTDRIVRASTSFHEEHIEGDEWLAGDDMGCRLRLELYALDKSTAFLYGSVNEPAFDIRSMLLRSEDGGVHWKEVMQPEHGSAVSEVFFLDFEHGWAIAMWTIEGAGPANLYRTVDAGRTWQKVAPLPAAPSPHSYPSYLDFDDYLRGSVCVHDVDRDEGEDCCRYETDDGGVTWTATDDCRCTGYWHRSELAGTLSDWELITIGGMIRVCRWTPEMGKHVFISEFPEDYTYREGHLTPRNP